MVINLDNFRETVGSIKKWIRPNNTTPIPQNWLILDGSVVADAASPFNGATLTDVRARFPRAHGTLTNASFPADVNYFLAAGSPALPTGGSDTVNLQHHHFAVSHQHLVNSDNANHAHGINNDSHTHNAPNGSPANVANGSALGKIDTYNHSHGGNTVAANAPHSHGGIVSANAGDNTTDSLGTAVENRPLFTEFVHIIRIK